MPKKTNLRTNELRTKMAQESLTTDCLTQGLNKTGENETIS